MAAATDLNWKRPWQDTTTTGGSEVTAAAGAPRHDLENLALASPYYNTFNQRSQARQPGIELERALSPVGPSPAPGQSVGQYQPVRRDSADVSAHSSRASPTILYNPYKRRCTHKPDDGEDMPRLNTDVRPYPEGFVAPRSSFSSTSATDGDDARRRHALGMVPQRPEDMALSRGLASMSTSDTRLMHGGGTLRDRRFSRAGTDSDGCTTCDRASNVAPQIARGLETLHGQLKLVLARDHAKQALSRVGVPRPRRECPC